MRVAAALCTRLPLALSPPASGADVARAAWALPLGGALVGAIGAGAFLAACALRLPPPLCAALALTATLLSTGALHEDGLADTADGLGGGADRGSRLVIMRDSRLGTYGACALTMSLLLRFAALAGFDSPGAAAAALFAAHVAGRAALPAFMHALPTARTEGLSWQAGRPGRPGAVAAALIGAAALAATLGGRAAVAGVLAAALTGLAMARLCLRTIGGQTGDVLGALEQAVEVAVLVTALASFKMTLGVRP